MIIEKNVIRRYLQFVTFNAKDYIKFSKQLVIGEIAGFLAGLLVAELAASLNLEVWQISLLSSMVDYAAGITGFFVIFYYDNRIAVIGLAAPLRVKQIFGMTLRMWPSVIAGDIVFLLTMPYVQLLLLSHNFNVAIASILAHLLASGAFNLTAILSKSIFDFYYSSSSSRNPEKSSYEY